MFIVQDYSLAILFLCCHNALLGIVGKYTEAGLEDLAV